MLELQQKQKEEKNVRSTEIWTWMSGSRVQSANH